MIKIDKANEIISLRCNNKVLHNLESLQKYFGNITRANAIRNSIAIMTHIANNSHKNKIVLEQPGGNKIEILIG